MIPLRRPWFAAALLFTSLFLLLLSFSPGSIIGMGYTGEEMKAGNSLLIRAHVLLHEPPPMPVAWTRHGLLPVLYDSPFLVAGALFPSHAEWQDRLLAWRPILLTTAIVTLIFLWVLRLTARPIWSFVIAVAGLFSTMLWPYAYIGLEDTQSFFLLLAAFLAFESDPFRSWLDAGVFSVCGACAVSSKATGVFLAPAVGFLLLHAYQKSRRREVVRLASAVVGIALVFIASAYSRAPFWKPAGGSFVFLRFWLVGDPLSWVSNFLAFFFSGNKGLFVYCPILVMLLTSTQILWRQHRNLLVFSLLTVLGLAGGFSLLRDWSDETWGPRYLHAAIAPFLVCIGACPIPVRSRSAILLLGAVLLGLPSAFLGSFFAYGYVHGAMTEAGQDTLENIQSDVVWNPIRFDARLFSVWARHDHGPVLLTPSHQWFYIAPTPNPGWKSVEIAKYAVPQPYVIRLWRAPLHATLLWYRWTLEVCAIAGLTFLAFACFLVVRRIGSERDETAGAVTRK